VGKQSSDPIGLTKKKNNEKTALFESTCKGKMSDGIFDVSVYETNCGESYVSVMW
jgi:hypothetical protein